MIRVCGSSPESKDPFQHLVTIGTAGNSHAIVRVAARAPLACIGPLRRRMKSLSTRLVIPQDDKLVLRTEPGPEETAFSRRPVKRCRKHSSDRLYRLSHGEVSYSSLPARSVQVRLDATHRQQPPG